MSQRKILAFSGSVRKESVNLKLLQVAISKLVEDGHEVRYWDFNENPLSLYDGDLEEEEGLPANAEDLKRAIEEADGVLIASPEYNAGPTPLLKNAIDWTSRPSSKKDVPDNPWEGKPVALMGASPSTFGAVRSTNTVQTVLLKLFIHLVQPVVNLPEAYNAFEGTQLANKRADQNVASLVENLVRATK